MHTITKADAKSLAAELRLLLAGFGEKHGLTVAINGGSYDETMYKPRLVFTVKQTVTGRPPAQGDFERYAEMLGLKPTDYGRTFINRGTEYRITGLRLGGRKGAKVDVVRVSDNRPFYFDRRAVMQAFGYKDPLAGVDGIR